MTGKRLNIALVAAAITVIANFISAPVIAEAAQPAHDWTIVPSPNEGGGMNSLASVFCVSPKSCMAVGVGTSDTATLAEAWNGSAWSVTSALNKGEVGDELNSVWCAANNSCIAVGDYGTRSGVDKTLAEAWNGTSWSVVPSPNPSQRFNYLSGVTCASAKDCLAVGTYGYNNGKPLVESWDGATWSVMVTPKLRGELFGVSCIQADDCIAVGATADGPLIESWNGKAWSIVQSRNGESGSGLADVSCASEESCMAVGTAVGSRRVHPLAEYWNGTAWSIVRTTDGEGGPVVELNAVSCPSPTSCVAVGGGSGPTLVEAWNGSVWKTADSPNKGDGGFVSGVSCWTPTKCIAVGSYQTVRTHRDKTLVESNSR